MTRRCPWRWHWSLSTRKIACFRRRLRKKERITAVLTSQRFSINPTFLLTDSVHVTSLKHGPSWRLFFVFLFGVPCPFACYSGTNVGLWYSLYTATNRPLGITRALILMLYGTWLPELAVPSCSDCDVRSLSGLLMRNYNIHDNKRGISYTTLFCV